MKRAALQQVACAAGVAMGSAHFGCARLAVDGSTWRATSESGAAVPTATMRLAAVADATVTSLSDWRDRSLGDAEWLMVGTSDAPASWFVLVEFDISVVPRNQPLSTALLMLHVRADPPLEAPTAPARVAIHHVVDPWTEVDTTWSAAPWVHGEPIGVLTIDSRPVAWDEAEVGEYVRRAIDAGEQRLVLALVPEPDEVDFRRLWNSRETVPEDPWSAASTAPTLELQFGDPLPGASAASRDVGRRR